MRFYRINIVALLAFTLALHSPFSLADTTGCATQFEKLISSGSFSHEDADYKYYHLGDGFNGDVYRVISKLDGIQFVKKNFKAGRENALANDMKAFAIFEKFFQEENIPIKIVKVREQKVNTLLLDYTRGMTLKNFMLEPSISTENKTQIMNLYAKAIQKLDAYLQKNYKVMHRTYREEGRLPTSAGLAVELEDKSLENGHLLIFFRDDNIIVNPETLEMTLIDPF